VAGLDLEVGLGASLLLIAGCRGRIAGIGDRLPWHDTRRF